MRKRSRERVSFFEATSFAPASHLPMNISQIHTELEDESRTVSLTQIDSGVTVLKQEIAPHVIWQKRQSFIEVKTLRMQTHTHTYTHGLNTNSWRTKEMAADLKSVKHRAAWNSPEAFEVPLTAPSLCRKQHFNYDCHCGKRAGNRLRTGDFSYFLILRTNESPDIF